MLDNLKLTFCFQQGSTTAGNSVPVNSGNEEVGGTIGFDLINALVGFENAENRMTELVAQINYFLTGKLMVLKHLWRLA